MSIDYVEQFQATLAEITQPLLAQYETLDRDIKQRELEIVAMRKARSQLRQMLRGINPELVGTTTNARRRDHPIGKGVGEERLVNLTTWLQERAEEINANGGIHASGMDRRSDYDGFAGRQSTLSHAFNILRDRGVIRLDHLGTGGAKFFKVVS